MTIMNKSDLISVRSKDFVILPKMSVEVSGFPERLYTFIPIRYRPLPVSVRHRQDSTNDTCVHHASGLRLSLKLAHGGVRAR